MPATKTKNLIYRAALPFMAPSPGPNPIISTEGEPLRREKGFVRLIKKHHVLGSATMLSFGGRESIVYTGSVNPRRAADAGTMFRVASITKMATALLSLCLVSEGLLDPDKPVSAYLDMAKPFPAELEGVTLRHLLSHTSGLADPPGMETALEAGEPWPLIISGCRLSGPGEAFHYSNLGFGLVGCVIEAVTGLPLGAVFDEKLFAPLGMNAVIDASSLDERIIMPVTRVLPFRRDPGMTKTPLGRHPLTAPDPLRHYGHTAGSMYTDIHSLAKLLECVRNCGEPLIPAETGGQMLKEHASYGKLSPTLSYGLGLLMIRDPLLSPFTICGHQGFAYGCADGAFWEEGTGCTVITLNGGASEARTGRLGLLNHDILGWALREEFPAGEEP